MNKNPHFADYVARVDGRREAARRLGVSVSLVGHILKGIRPITPEIARRVEVDSGGCFGCENLLPEVQFIRDDLGNVVGHVAPLTASAA